MQQGARTPTIEKPLTQITELSRRKASKKAALPPGIRLSYCLNAFAILHKRADTDDRLALTLAADRVPR